MSVLRFCPTPPKWFVDWDAIRSEYEWAEALHECDQDSVFHAEGDVGTHTRTACEALIDSDQFRQLPEAERQIVFAAVLLHDVAKPNCTVNEGERITSRGHSNHGEILTRQMLWREGVPFSLRESICSLVRHHQLPFFLLDRADSQKRVFAVSQVVRCDHLSLVAWADAQGRYCADAADQQRMLNNAALFREYCEEQECLSVPRQFPSDHSRFLYFQKHGRDPNYHAHDDTRCEVTMMSGLPATGKDYWLSSNTPDLPVVSLDDIRIELGIDPADSQGRVIDTARQRARQLLRERTSFAWNATNLSRHIRTRLISLFAAYNARIRVVYVEGSIDLIAERNRNREKVVPDKIMKKLMNRWTVPTLVEAHAVETVLSNPPKVQ